MNYILIDLNKFYLSLDQKPTRDVGYFNNLVTPIIVHMVWVYFDQSGANDGFTRRIFFSRSSML